MQRAMLMWAGTIALLLGGSGPGRAGMPSPLPSEDAVVRVVRLNDSVDLRLQAISFFFVGLLSCAAIVRWLWNYIARDWPFLPRLSFGKALASVILWGLLFFLVLTMISGARELMTPGAWKKQGFTYKLDDDWAPADVAPSVSRRQHLEQLRQALWHFAATHRGQFPSEDQRTAIPADLWIVPETGGMRYRYFAGKTVEQSTAPLIVAPELESGWRQVLRTDGTIANVPASEIPPVPAKEKQP
jgi:hypothetical protein